MLRTEVYDSLMEPRRTLLTKLFALLAAGLQSRRSWAFAPAKSSVRVLRTEALAGRFAGLEGTAVEVTFPPGSASGEHRHPGFILGYVLEGRFRFAVNGEPERILGAGETFYEPAGALHSVSANALADKQTRILAFMVAPAGKPIVER
jgi:quercetin dioxygenase-like cupin family protein